MKREAVMGWGDATSTQNHIFYYLYSSVPRHAEHLRFLFWIISKNVLSMKFLTIASHLES